VSKSVHLSVTAGPMKGKSFAFDEHDTFLFGRREECHCCLPDDGQGRGSAVCTKAIESVTSVCGVDER